MAASFRPKNRTTVRAQSVALRATRAGLRVLSPRAPDLAARWAERLFLTARRHERPRWEEEALASSRRGRVAHEGGWLPTWTWSPTGRASLDEPPAVILVHGWEGRGSQLARFAEPLVARGLRVVAFDAPGHGDATASRASLVEHARALVSVARAAGDVHAVVGHSVGGAAALFATRLGLRAERFVLLAPPTSPVPFTATFSRILGLDPEVERAMIARVEARYRISMRDLDARLDAARLPSPLLVVHDADDRVVPIDSGRGIARSAPRAELLETTGLGHHAILRAPEVIDRVARFVGQGVRRCTFAETLEGELFLRDTRWS